MPQTSHMCAMPQDSKVFLNQNNREQKLCAGSRAFKTFRLFDVQNWSCIPISCIFIDEKCAAWAQVCWGFALIGANVERHWLRLSVVFDPQLCVCCSNTKWKRGHVGCWGRFLDKGYGDSQKHSFPNFADFELDLVLTISNLKNETRKLETKRSCLCGAMVWFPSLFGV